ncbi:MAG: CoA transferase, partial [Chloroflexi bacterium]|nr:CoA transferase [Chloroflexota bacterium]
MQDKMTDTVLGPYRALDLTDEKGSFCTKLMGILGAEVIKIEKPGGSEERQIGPFYQGTPDPEKSLHWFLYNLNKKSITLDIASPDGKETFKKLVASADFVIESFAPGYLESIGLGYKELARIKPRLIVTSVTPFGQAGPYRDFKTSTLILHALGGLTWTVGEEGGRPVDTNSQLANIITGTQAALATMAAHYYREETGEGQYVDVSMQEGMINLALPVDLRWKSHHIMPYRAPAGPLFAGDLFGGGAMLGKAKDGYLVCMPTYWPGRDKVREWLASEGLAGDLFNPEWETIFKQGIAVPEDKRAYVFQLTQQLCARYTKKELVMEAQKKGIQFLPVSTIKELAEDVHLADRGYFRKVKHPELGTDITYHGFPFGLGEGLRKDWVRAPLIGEHNNELNDMLKPKKRQPAKRATAIDPADPRGALSGVRVADFSHVAVGPVTTHLLADFGAEVIKIESTARLEILRRQGPYKNNVPDLNGNILFNNYNQNKMSALL